MKVKMDKFNENVSSVDAKRRLVFLMTYEDLRQKIEDKKRKDLHVDKVKSIMKMIVARARHVRFFQFRKSYILRKM